MTANLQKSLSHSRVRIGLLVGTLSKKERNGLLELMAAGEVDVVVETQALLSEDVQFKRLGLVIVDEQHKFGVLQCGHLRHDNLQPHNLILQRNTHSTHDCNDRLWGLGCFNDSNQAAGKMRSVYLLGKGRPVGVVVEVCRQANRTRSPGVCDCSAQRQTAVDEEDESSVGTKLIASAEAPLANFAKALSLIVAWECSTVVWIGR